MRETHDGMSVTAGELHALVEDLVATLDEFDVPNAEQEQLLGLLGPMRDAIVEVESLETGQPLPATYQAAPALRGVPAAVAAAQTLGISGFGTVSEL